MGSAVRKKLHSRRGASLLIALLYFLTAMTVGAVVLAGAAANSGRIARNRQEQQDYLTVASAAELIKSDFRGSVLRLGYTKTEVETTVTTTYATGDIDWDYDEDYPEYAWITDEGYGLSGGSELLPKDDLESIYMDMVAYEEEEEFGEELYSEENIEHSLEFALAEDALPEGSELPEVSGTMTVSTGKDEWDTNAPYTIAVNLHTAVSEEDAYPTNTMTMLFTPTVRKVASSEVEEKTEVVTEGDDYDGYDTTTTFTVTTVTTYTTTISWGDPKVTKEVYYEDW